MLVAHGPDKLQTSDGRCEGHDIRIIDEDGTRGARGEVGEIVGRSPT